MRPIEIQPALLTDSYDRLEEQVGQLKPLISKGLQRVQLDVIDGIFADNVTLMPGDLVGFDWQGLGVDVQLMTIDPVEQLGGVFQMGASRVYGHVERMGRRDEFMGIAAEMHLEVGWALDLYTPIEELTKEELLRSDGILLMSVPAGFSGQKFKDYALSKARSLRELGYAGDLVLDGGVGENELKAGIEAGVNQFAIGTSLWQTGNVSKRWQELSNILKEAHERKRTTTHPD